MPNLRRYLEVGGAGGKEEEEGERREKEEGRRKKGGERREEEEGRREKGRGREKGKEEGENNGWNATVTKENGSGELGQKERRKESLPGCVTTAMVVDIGREAADTPSHFSVFSSIPDATTSRDTLMEEGVKGKGRGREENRRGGGEGKHTM